MRPCLPSPPCLLRPWFPYCPPPPASPFGDHPWADERCLPALLRLLLVPPGHEPLGCFDDLFAAVVYSTVSTPNTNGECSVYPSLTRNALRPLSRRLCQVFGCPPGHRFFFSQPIVVTMARLGNRPSLCMQFRRHLSCAIKDFVETHLCGLGVMLRSRVVRDVYVLMNYIGR